MNNRTTTTNETAAQRYAARRNDIARLLDMHAGDLAARDEEAKADPKDWGKAHDLDLIRHELLNTVAFASRLDREDIEGFLADAD